MFLTGKMSGYLGKKMGEDDRVARLNVTEEVYFETTDALMRERGYAMVTDIVEELGIRPPSVTSMLKKLDALDFVKYTPYRNVTLTEKGNDLAAFLKEQQRSLQTFLTLLGVDEAVAEKDACAIEHILQAPYFGEAIQIRGVHSDYAARQEPDRMLQ